MFSPSVFSPSVFSPAAFNPFALSPSVFSPSVFSPSVFSPDRVSQAFTSAQTRSLIGISAQNGTASESISSLTWNNTGAFYVRVQGRNGAFDTDGSYALTVTTTDSSCSATLSDGGASTITGTPGTARTVILTDPTRLPGTSDEKATLATRLTAFANAVGGVVVDVGTSPKVTALNRQADDPANRACPYAKNLVAEAIRDVVNSYRDAAGTLGYVVVVGADDVVPFFRYPDAAGLGPESNYAPPVGPDTASEASLRGNYVLGQDAYGAVTDLVLKGASFPVPDLPVGRLVEGPVDIAATLAAYAARAGAPIRPTSTLATGYDFLTDAADSVAADFTAGVPGGRHDTLITDADVPPSTTTVGGSPSRRTSWTATDLRSALLGQRHDLVYLAGHFSANNALAADYATTVDTGEILTAPTGTFDNTLVFSAGCHSGYTVVDRDGIPQVTAGLDWTEAFARRGATLVAGTGYQYGDTELLAYSERLYADFAHQLRVGTGEVAVGTALVRAKQDYLERAVSLAGIDQKSILEATLYGLPMQGVDLPAAGRLSDTGDASEVSPVDVVGGAGDFLGLQAADLQTSSALSPVTTTLTNLDGGTVAASYLRGPDGTTTSPAAPVLPVDSHNVTVPGSVLRGVGLRSATYTDTDGVTPLTGAPATEVHGVHGPFVSTAFHPARLAVPNYFDALGTSGARGTTRLQVTPVQYRGDGSAGLTSTQRRYAALGLRLFYSSNVTRYDANQPALAAPPSISGVESTIDGSTVTVRAHVVGDPAAGLQQVWMSHTGERGGTFHGTWASVDLAQDSADSTLWSGQLTLPGGQPAAGVRFIIQAVNGVGLVGVDDNRGTYFVPGVTAGSPDTGLQPTTLVLTTPPTTGAYGAGIPVAARLTAGGAPLPGRGVAFAIGGSSRFAVTGTDGVARTVVPLNVLPGDYLLTAGFAGDAVNAGSSGPPSSFRVTRQPTSITVVRGPTDLVATVTSTVPGAPPLPLRERAVHFAVTDSAGAVLAAKVLISDLAGAARFPLAGLPVSAASVTASFGSAAAAVPTGPPLDLSDPAYLVSSATLSLTSSPPRGCTIVGTAGNDTLVGTSGRDVICGLGGNDTITGGGGDDLLIGGPGNDTLSGGAGNDALVGDEGDDTLLGEAGNDVLTGGVGNDRLSGGAGADLLVGDDGADTLSGDAGNDALVGWTGNDTLRGGDGDDALTGGTGVDQVYGEGGNDALDVKDGVGGDLADGGAGTRDTARSDPGDTVRAVP